MPSTQSVPAAISTIEIIAVMLHAPWHCCMSGLNQILPISAARVAFDLYISILS